MSTKKILSATFRHGRTRRTTRLTSRCLLNRPVGPAPVLVLQSKKGGSTRPVIEFGHSSVLVVVARAEFVAIGSSIICFQYALAYRLTGMPSLRLS
jgi:hypothetical protein